MGSATMIDKNYESFEKETKRLFRFLETKYGFKIASIEKSPPNVGIHIVYLNPTTAVQVGYEPAENFIPVYLMRLVNGHLPKYPEEYSSNTFYLDRLFAVRAPNLVINQKPRKNWLSTHDVRINGNKICYLKHKQI